MQNKKPVGDGTTRQNRRQNLPTLLLTFPLILETTEIKASKLN